MEAKATLMDPGRLRQLALDALEHTRSAVSGENGSHFGKEQARALHEPARIMELAAHQNWLHKRLPDLLAHFADGSEVNPEKTQPTLLEVEEKWQYDLFRAARLLWSLPYSKGFGRRLQFLVLDTSNDKLMGLIGLQSPPMSFPARDVLFDYPPGRKTELVNQTMDIYTLGAVPPYSALLGAKLMALIVSCNDVRKAYTRKYKGRETEMEGRIIPARLVALTTTSAYGRSSIYNRVTYDGEVIAERIGYTEGYGSFHLSELYPLFREFLEERGISTRGGFGVGPRIKWQTMARALERLGLSSRLLRHGVRREAFLFRLIKNLDNYMEGCAKRPTYRNLPFDRLAAYWCERWLLPRAERVDGWSNWNRSMIEDKLILSQET